MLDDLKVRLSLPTRTAVVDRAVALLAAAQGLSPAERMPADKFHPWLRKGGLLPGQGNLQFSG